MIIAVFEMHQLDELENEISVPPYVPEEVVDLVVVDPAQDYHVEFDRGKARL